MTIRNTYAAETWDKVYDAFTQINFTSYDYDTVKESLLQYLKIYYAESFNDFIESSELIAILELFAYVAEQLAYRIDLAAHENFITTAQRKQSVLRLARLVSYRASRNIPARGLVKLTTVRTTETVVDSLGNNLANVSITWNDPNNPNWKEQFFLVMNKVMTSKFGQPQKSFQVNDVLLQLYTFNNDVGTFTNGVFSFTPSTGTRAPLEVVPADLDENGPFERAPDLNSQLNLLYASDGRGDSSDYTGFLLFIKQGTLTRTDYTILEPTENRRLELDAANINDTDIWVYRVDDLQNIIEVWKRVESLNEQNLFFNDDSSTRKKFEVETLENDRVALLFGDNNFSDAPVGNFQIWARVSLNQNITIERGAVLNQPMAFSYKNASGQPQTFSCTFSLTSPLTNNAASETAEQIRQAAPATYYAQNRMVNAQDYNTFMLKDPTILRLKTINRTFAGQPKYIEWNDASGNYQNIKLFGDDLVMFYDISLGALETATSAKGLIDAVIEPLLSKFGVFNALNYISDMVEDGYGIISNPRTRFIEDNQSLYKKLNGTNVTPYGSSLSPSDVTAGSLTEKSAIQANLDGHWYGEPLGFVTIGGVRHGIIPDPILVPEDDGKLYDDTLPRTIDGVNTYPPGDVGSGLQTTSASSYFGLRFNRFMAALGNGRIWLADTNNIDANYGPVTIAPAHALTQYPKRIEVFTIELQDDRTTFTVISNLRGRLPSYSLLSTNQYYLQQNPKAPINFRVEQGTTSFEPGDAFIVELKKNGANWETTVRDISGAKKANLKGWWQIISPSELSNPTYNIDLSSGGKPTLAQVLNFDPNDPVNSWLILVAADYDTIGNVKSWRVFYRNMRLVAESPTTKFWFNQTTQIIDPQTKKPVYDKLSVLRSNLDPDGLPLLQNDVYDVVGFVQDADGNINFNQLEVLPTDTTGFTTAGDGLPDNILQFLDFSRGAFQFFLIDNTNPSNPTFAGYLSCTDYQVETGFDVLPFDVDNYDDAWVTYQSVQFNFEQGSFISLNYHVIDGTPYYLGRRRRVPPPALYDANLSQSVCNANQGLDFMWQHFSPNTNLIDPSVTNIHDAFIMTRGYYTALQSFIRGQTTTPPTPPTPLELRTAYGYLLKNKMLSDTVVLHPGRIKLLFGALADAPLRAKFRVVKQPTTTMSNERIKAEVIAVINAFFDIQNWDFGDTFYATELIALIHQRLAGHIASVVLVPTYSVNSFGSLFTVEAGLDEILQSCATVSDVELVDALTPTVLRQR
jgi:hypothetical protein